MSVIFIAYTMLSARLYVRPSFSFEFLEPVPINQSPILAVRLIAGLQIVNVHSPQNGFGAAPSSILKMYE